MRLVRIVYISVQWTGYSRLVSNILEENSFSSLIFKERERERTENVHLLLKYSQWELRRFLSLMSFSSVNPPNMLGIFSFDEEWHSILIEACNGHHPIVMPNMNKIHALQTHTHTQQRSTWYRSYWLFMITCRFPRLNLDPLLNYRERQTHKGYSWKRSREREREKEENYWKERFVLFVFDSLPWEILNLYHRFYSILVEQTIE